MKKTLLSLSIIALTLSACGQAVNNNNTAASASGSTVAGLETENKQFSYFIGYHVAQNMQLNQFKKTDIQFDKDAIFAGIQDQINEKEPKLSNEAATKLMENVYKKVEAAIAAAASETRAEGVKFLSENKAKEGITELPSGLQIKTNKAGEGDTVAKGDVAHIEYEGRLINGTVFDSTQSHGGQAVAFPVFDGQIIPGMIEGLQQMKAGGEYTLYIPSGLAYGTDAHPKIPANSVLIFDIKVAKVEKGAGKKFLEQLKAEQEKAIAEMMKAQEQGAH